jgi:ATP-binding cassette subfamily F protein 3
MARQEKESGIIKSKESDKSNGSNKSIKKTEQPKPRLEIKKAVANTPVNKEHKKELQKQQRIFEQLEEKIAVVNKQKAAYEAALADPETYSDKIKFLKAEEDYKKSDSELAQLNKQYEQVFEKIMKLEAQQS